MSGPAAAELAEVAELARQVLAMSDARDAELGARMQAYRKGYAVGLAQAEAQRRAGYLAAIADMKRSEAELVALYREYADAYEARWHLCCPRCRRGGHRAGCRDCQDRTRETFAGPMAGEYQGGPVAWLPGWAPGSGTPPEAMRGAA